MKLTVDDARILATDLPYGTRHALEDDTVVRYNTSQFLRETRWGVEYLVVFETHGDYYGFRVEFGSGDSEYDSLDGVDEVEAAPVTTQPSIRYVVVK